MFELLNTQTLQRGTGTRKEAVHRVLGKRFLTHAGCKMHNGWLLPVQHFNHVHFAIFDVKPATQRGILTRVVKMVADTREYAVIEEGEKGEDVDQVEEGEAMLLRVRRKMPRVTSFHSFFYK